MWGVLLLGLAGLMLGLALPFAPVHVATTTVTWPAPDRPVISSSVVFAPYRPTNIAASVPCSALRAAAARSGRLVVLATGVGDRGLVLTGGSDGTVLRLDGREVPLAIDGDDAADDCAVTIASTAGGLSVTTGGRTSELPGARVPAVFGFRTDLDPTDAAGISVTASTTDPFATTPSVVKCVLICLQLIAATAALLLLRRTGPTRNRRRPRWRRTWWVDVGVVATLAGWAVIGPLAVDDGWATMIARNVTATGNPGNYYRWWNAAEVPFAFSQELLAPFTAVSVAPLWLRLPSTLLAVATWFVLSRGVLGAALPVRSATGRVRLLAAACLLAAWLPFNLGVRPESYVALGTTVTLALALRARDLRSLGLLALVVGVTVPISPNGVLVAAPIVVFGPRLVAVLRTNSRTRLHLVAHLMALSCVCAVGFTIIFADQTWDALVTATDWHTFFGPALPWYEEPDRYRYLLQSDQQGSFGKRLPVLIAVATLPIVGLLATRRRHRDFVGRAAVRLGLVVAVALLLFALSPSKWSYHLGAAAGLFAALLTVAVVFVFRVARRPNRYVTLVCTAGTVLTAAAAALAFGGPNAWWIPAVYDVPWAAEPPRPLGIPLDNPLTWIVSFGVVAVIRNRAHRLARAPTEGPAIIVLGALGITIALLLGSFVAAPIRRAEGSLAIANLGRLNGTRVCGLADDVQVLPDGPILAASPEGGEQLGGFSAEAGYPAGAPPPDAPGTGTSTYLWGSRGSGDQATARMISTWFTLPPQPANGGVAVSVSGRTEAGNELAFEFGRADGAGVIALGERAPVDRPAPDEDPAHPLWRSIGVDATDIPVGADRIRIRALDGRVDSFGWLAVTGPRLRSAIGLTEYLADKGPVLIGWPQSFLFPCVHDIAEVSAGVAATPRTVIESPRPWEIGDRDPNIGGTFAALAMFGDLHEIPSRLVGHPDVDWGSVQESGDVAARDGYQRTVTHDLVSGIGGVRRTPPEH